MIIKFEVNTNERYDISEAIRMLESLGSDKVIYDSSKTAQLTPATLGGANTIATQSNDKSLFAAQAAPLLDAPASPIVITSKEEIAALVLTDGDAVETATIHEIIAPPAASEGEAFAAMQAAVARGVQLPVIVALLNDYKVSRVNQLGADDRALFVAKICTLGRASR